MRKFLIFIIFISINNIIFGQTNYTFNGNGNWSDSLNWLYNTPPPSILPKLDQIIINPIANGECILNTPQYITDSGQITVLPNKRFRIINNLIINKKELNDHVHVIDSSQLTLISDTLMLNQGIYEYTSSDSIPVFNVNDYIVGDLNNGYLRKVTNVSYTRPSAQNPNSLFSATLQTIRAKFIDIVKNGVFYMETPVDNSIIGLSGNNLTINIPTATYTNGPLSIILSNANISFDPKWHIDFNITNSSLNHFEIACKNATLNSSFHLNTTVSQAVTLAEKSELLKHYSKKPSF